MARKKCIELYGNHFKILETDYPIIYKLIAYFLKDEATCCQLGIEINKGILLSSPIGCSKTSIMLLIKPFTNFKYDYKIKTTRGASFEFDKSGFEALQIYTHKFNKQNRLTGSYFDDLGAEK